MSKGTYIVLSPNTTAQGVAIVDEDGIHITDFASNATLADLLTCCNAIDANTDGLEVLLTSIDAKVSTALNQSTQITNQGTIITNQSTIIANQGTEGVAPPLGTRMLGWLRSIYVRLANIELFNFTGGALDVNAVQGPTKFVKDAVDTEVAIDTVTPANNDPLPAAMYNELGMQGSTTNPFGVSIVDFNTGAINLVDKNGAIKTGEAIILNGDVFGGVSPSAEFWTFGGTGANVTQAGNERIETGTVADGSRQFQTKKKARFMGSQFNVFHSGINLPDLLNDDVIFRMGAFNPLGTSNGAYFEVEGGAVPVWYAVTVKNGVPTKVPQGSWTGKGAANFNATPGLAVYEMIYNAGTVSFKQGPNVVHTQAVNILGETYANTYHFNVGLEVENINGNTVNNGMEVYAAVIYRNGEERGETIAKAFRTTAGTFTQLVKTGAGYISFASLSRAGSGGGAGVLEIFDGIDDTGSLMRVYDVGGDDLKGGQIGATYSDGLFIRMTGSGTKTANLSLE